MPELASARPGPGAVQLLEVRGEDAPNVLTNDPGFFSHKTGDAAVLELKLSTEFRNNIKLNSPSIDIFTESQFHVERPSFSKYFFPRISVTP